jgi:hypothetical protein
MRQDKDALTSASGDVKARQEKNARFFDQVEGVGSMSAETAIDGLYVTVQPQLGLGEVPVGAGMSGR